MKVIKKVVYIEKSKVDLYHLSKFIDRYFSYLAESRTQKEAWQQTEKEFVSVFGEQRFSSFDSFRKIRNGYLLSRQQHIIKNT